MQADNLRPEDFKKFEELFEKVKEENPKARFVGFGFQRGKFQKKDCLFKDKCKP